MKKWLRAQLSSPRTVTELKALADLFAHEYNQRSITDPCPAGRPWAKVSRLDAQGTAGP
jgi:hypothetical protein